MYVRTFMVCSHLLCLTMMMVSAFFFWLQAHVCKTGSLCATFLVNIDNQSDKTVTFNGKVYKLPAWSVSILPDCKNVVLNTAQVCALSCSRQRSRVSGTNLDLGSDFGQDNGWRNLSVLDGGLDWNPGDVVDRVGRRS